MLVKSDVARKLAFFRDQLQYDEWYPDTIDHLAKELQMMKIETRVFLGQEETPIMSWSVVHSQSPLLCDYDFDRGQVVFLVDREHCE